MRIGFDYLTAVCHAPGVGRYGRELVRAMVRLQECPQLALFEIGGGERVMEGAPLGLEAAPAGRVKRLRLPLPRRAIELGSRLFGLGADRLLGGVDLFHRTTLDYPPVSRAPEVLPVSELPDVGSATETRMRAAARRAVAVVVFSEHYAHLVIDRFGLDTERVHITPVGCDHWVRDRETDARESAQLGADAAPRAPQILALGALRSERSPDALVAGYTRWIESGGDQDLCFIGRTGDATEAFERARAASSASHRIRWISDPRESDMPRIVAASTVLVHLDAVAGTPVTPLEAMAMGLPVVARRLPAFVEALGETAIWIDQDDSLTLAEAIETATIQAQDAESRELRLACARRHPWSRCAEATLQVWRQALER
ncbi:MAG: glycosyltransferase involved in cell wall biosynthesis [Planctomycetota bacterium]|jgi:glycosyltransferase involved in cell wall biosynthesis